MSPSRRRLRVLALALALPAALVACGIDTSGTATATPDEDVPFGLLDAEARPIVPTTLPPAAATVALCLVDDQDRLALVVRPVARPLRPASVVAELAREELPEDTPHRTALPSPSPVRSVELVGGVAHVDLAAEIDALPAGELQLAIAQIVCTLTGLPGVGQVAFALDGVPTEVPTAAGALASRPVTREDYEALLP